MCWVLLRFFKIVGPILFYFFLLLLRPVTSKALRSRSCRWALNHYAARFTVEKCPVMLQRSVRVAEATQGLSREKGQGAGRSTHDESMFHMADRIPDGTKRKRGVSVEKVESRRGPRGEKVRFRQSCAKSRAPLCHAADRLTCLASISEPDKFLDVALVCPAFLHVLEQTVGVQCRQ